MTRTIGGQSLWGTAVWSAAPGLEPFGSTWSVDDLVSDIEAVLSRDPDPSEGTSVGPGALGGLRFVVQALNPRLAGDALWDVALWNVDTWSASVGDWSDISDRVRGLSWNIGVESPSDPPRVGTGTITLENTDGEASPWATTGEFEGFGDRPWLRSGLLVRWGVIVTNSDPLPAALEDFNAFFTGRVESVQEGTSENADAWVNLTIVETTAELAVTAPDVPTLHGRTLSETFGAVLLAADWPYQTSLEVPSEDTLVDTTTLSGDTVAALLQRVADGLHWGLVADGRGRVALVRRHIAELDSGLTFSNDPSGDELPMIDVTPYSNIERVINAVSASHVNGELQSRYDTASIAQFGIITERYDFPRDDLVLADSTKVVALLNRVLGLYADDDLGIEAVSLDMDMDAENLPAVMTYIAAYTRGAIAAHIRWVHPSGNEYSERITIESQHHSITKEGEQLKWLATLGTHRDFGA